MKDIISKRDEHIIKFSSCSDDAHVTNLLMLTQKKLIGPSTWQVRVYALSLLLTLSLSLKETAVSFHSGGIDALVFEFHIIYDLQQGNCHYKKGFGGGENRKIIN